MEHQYEIFTKIAVGVLRVSTFKQYNEGDSPESQKEQIIRKAKEFNISEDEIEFFEIAESASGENQPAQIAIDYCENNPNIKYFFIKSIDRLTRGGASTYSVLRDRILNLGVALIDVYGVIAQKRVNTLDSVGFEYPWSVISPNSINEIITAEASKEEVRTILVRMIGAEIKYEQLGYCVRGANYGYKNMKIDTPHGKRTIMVPNETEEGAIRDIFRLRIQGTKSDEEIAEYINQQGFRTRTQKVRDKATNKVIGYKGNNSFTSKIVKKYVRNPIYAGFIVSKWTNEKPVKCPFEGIVSVEDFNKANRGEKTIHEENGQYFIYEGAIPEWRKLKNRDNPLYPYKPYVYCPICYQPLLGSAPRNKSGKHIPRYHCSRKHKYWSINKIKFDKTIEDFVKSVDFTDAFVKDFMRIFKEEWHKRQPALSETTKRLAKRLVELESDITSTKSAMKLATSKAVVSEFDNDLAKLICERDALIAGRNKKADKQLNIEIALNHAKYYMEHLEELVFEGEDEKKKAFMFGLLFEEPPTYVQLENGTPKLAHIFKLKDEYKKSKESLVTLRGIEPRLSG